MATVSSGGMERLSVPFGSVVGVPLRVHIFLPAVALVAVAGAVMAGGGVLGALFAALTSGPLLILTVLAHELGHVFAAKRCGLVPEHILLWPLGGLAVIGAGSVSHKQQIFISGAGPATHLPMSVFWIVLLAAVNGGGVTLSTDGMSLERDFMAVLSMCLLMSNISMFVFNLLVPCFPLDCSQILISAMLIRGHDNTTTAKVMVGLSVPVILVLAGLACWSYLTANPSSSLHLFLAMWLAMQTWQLHSARVQGALNSHPLFAAEASRKPATGVPGGANATGGAIGKMAAPGAQACAGSALILIITLMHVLQTAV